MRPFLGQTLVALLVVGCSTRAPVLPPPAPATAAPAPLAAPPEPSIESARRAEESIERVDVSALQSHSVPAAPKATAATPVTTPGAMLRARVLDPLGRPVAGALVVLHSLTDGEEHRARSDGDGGVSFTGLAPGDYLLGGDPADDPELVAIPLRLAAGDSPDTIEIRLTNPRASGGEALRELTRPQVSA
jgi:hypothetical protein